jgi:hypothetical protein
MAMMTEMMCADVSPRPNVESARQLRSVLPEQAAQVADARLAATYLGENLAAGVYNVLQKCALSLDNVLNVYFRYLASEQIESTKQSARSLPINVAILKMFLQ